MKFNITDPIIIDTETYYDGKRMVSVRKNMKKEWVGGNWHYTNHPEFYCYMLSYFDLTTHESGVLDTVPEMQEFLSRNRGRTMVGHNVAFDVAVCKWLVPDFEPLNTVDTADMAAYFQCARDLASASQYLLGKEISKVERDLMDGVHYRELPEERKQRMRDYALNDALVTADIYKAFVEKMPDIELFLSDHTRRRNWEGVRIDTNRLESEIDRLKAVRSQAVRLIPWMEGDCDGAKPLSAKALARWCRDQGILPPASLAEDSPECIAWENQYGEAHPVVGAMRAFRKSNTYLKKLRVVELLLRPDGTIPLDAMYAAAPHTLRWSGRTFNHQSLPRDPEQCDLRGCLIPPEGHLWVGSDLAQIEARCLPWLAGDGDALAALSKMDIYEAYARRFKWYSDPRPLKKVDPMLRHAAKCTVLQLGYQSGANKFQWYLETSDAVPPGTIDRVRKEGESNNAVARRLVNTYRESNPKIVALWKTLQHELIWASETNGDASIETPAGRTVYYRKLHRVMRRKANSEGVIEDRIAMVGFPCHGEPPRDLYGGKLVENVCQHTARDVVAECLWRAEAAGIPVSFTVHDELVTHVPATEAEDARKALEELMSVTPEWLPGCPIAAEAATMERYAK